MIKRFLLIGLLICLGLSSLSAQTSSEDLSLIEVDFSSFVMEADAYLENGDVSLAVIKLTAAENILINQAEDIREVLKGHHNRVKGKYYLTSSNYSTALTAFNLSRSQFAGNETEKAITDLFIGIVYTEQNMLSDAQNLFLGSKTIFENVNDHLNLAQTMNNIGTVYYQQNNVSSAISYFNQALLINNAIGNLRNASINQRNLDLIQPSSMANYISVSGKSSRWKSIFFNKSFGQCLGNTVVKVGDVKTNGGGTIVIRTS